jgi:hypothetical protein
MKRHVLAIMSAAGIALALLASPARAGFELLDFFKAPRIFDAEIVAPVNDTDASIILTGLFCDDPSVYQGTPTGFQKLLLLELPTRDELSAALANYEPGITSKFGVVCGFHWPRVETIDVTIPTAEEPIEEDQ